MLDLDGVARLQVHAILHAAQGDHGLVVDGAGDVVLADPPRLLLVRVTQVDLLFSHLAGQLLMPLPVDQDQLSR